MSQSPSPRSVLGQMNSDVCPSCANRILHRCGEHFACAWCGAALRFDVVAGVELVGAAPIFTRRELARLRSAVEAIEAQR